MKGKIICLAVVLLTVLAGCGQETVSSAVPSPTPAASSQSEAEAETSQAESQPEPTPTIIATEEPDMK